MQQESDSLNSHHRNTKKPNIQHVSIELFNSATRASFHKTWWKVSTRTEYHKNITRYQDGPTRIIPTHKGSLVDPNPYIVRPWTQQNIHKDLKDKGEGIVKHHV